MWLCLGEYRGPRKAHALVAYMAARATERAEERSFRVYVTDALHLQGKGAYPAQRWAELLQPRKEIDVDDTIDMVVGRLGGE